MRRIFITVVERQVFDSFSCDAAEILNEQKKGILRIIGVRSETMHIHA